MTLPTQALEQSSTSTPPLWTVEDVAAYLQLSPETVRVMARNGEIPGMKLGKRLWRFAPNQVQDWLQTTKGPLVTENSYA